MIFGELLTGSNFDDNEERITGGRNGYGAKLANILSSRFTVRTGDSKRRKMLTISWRNNMKDVSDPVIEKFKGESFTEVSFKPDLRLFKMEELSDDMVSLFKKRVIDLAGVLPKKVKVVLNDESVKCRDFKGYCKLYFREQVEREKRREEDPNADSGEPFEVIYTSTKRWEVGMVLAETKFAQVSFVNSICTSRGGSHVNYIVEQIIQKTTEKILKKHRRAGIRPYYIKNNLFIFVNCLIENPKFDSQTKETLKTRPNQFGSKCELGEVFLGKVMQTGLIESIMMLAEAKEKLAMAKTLSAKKKKKLIGVDKLEDANKAGGRESSKCRLILTEGDSAKALAMAGLEIVGRDYYGVFPLRGKLLNVREANNAKIMKNKEIQEIIKIVGLQVNKEYQDVKSLRYGGIMIMTDQDVDGSHIKGLIMNFVSYFWPSLIRLSGFMVEFFTPILKAFGPGKVVFPFYTQQDFRQWASTRNDLEKFEIKYYKGLGTSTDAEAREYFREFRKHTITFTYNSQQDLDSLEMVFGKKNANRRKEWLEDYDEDLAVDHKRDEISYREFVDQEMIHFSVYNNMRSICHLVDGLKPSKRKILFGFFKKNMKKEVKVAQISGYIAEHSAYHHGEQSLQKTIVNLAQNFVGSNNLNLLEPIGQFGTRLMGGADHASARYIHTKLSPIARKLFVEHDDHLLDYNIDDGMVVEPKFYVPILPYILINGSMGIGTGYSSSIPCFKIEDICDQIIGKLDSNRDFGDMVPWYKGFDGEIVSNPGKGFISRGTFEVDESEDVLRITELPIKMWTRKYKDNLEKMIRDEELIEDFTEHHTIKKVHFEIALKPDTLGRLGTSAKINKVFKLESTVPTTNMMLFNAEGRMRKYQRVGQILDEFYALRLDYYSRRKKYLLSLIDRELQTLENKIRFISAIVEEKLVIRKKKGRDIVAELIRMGFLTTDQLPQIESTKIKANDKRKGVIQEERSGDSDEEDASGGKSSGNSRDDQRPAALLLPAGVQVLAVDPHFQYECGEGGEAPEAPGREEEGLPEDGESGHQKHVAGGHPRLPRLSEENHEEGGEDDRGGEQETREAEEEGIAQKEEEQEEEGQEDKGGGRQVGNFAEEQKRQEKEKEKERQ